MTFLEPTPAIIAGSLAGPALVALYLLKLRRRPIRVSSIALWERAEEDLQANIPFRWIRPSWLFVLHALILAFLVLAIGRPAVAIPGLGGASRVVILIDRSASMSARDMPEGRPRLDEAKRRAKALARELLGGGSGRTAAVVAFARDPQALTRFTASASIVADAIDSVTSTDQPGDLRAALELVEAILSPRAEEEASSEAAEVILFSDGSFREIPARPLRGGQVRLEPVGPETPGENAGIVALAARRDYQDPATLRVFARVQRSSPRPRTIPATLSLDGRVLERRTFDWPGNSTTGEGGSSSVPLTFECATPEGGVVMLSLGAPDVLRADDSAALVVAPASRPAILLVRPDPAGAPGTTPASRPSDFLLSDALEELRPRELRVVGAGAGERLLAESASPFDLVIFDRVTPARVPREPTISFGAGLPIAGGHAEASTAGDDAPATGMLWWDRRHPILRYTPLDAVRVVRPMTLDDAPGVALARGPRGPLMTLLDDAGVRRLIVGFDLADSNWTLQVGFPIFLASAVDHLTQRGEASAGRAFTTGEPARVALRPGTGPIVLDGPAHLEVPGSSVGMSSMEASLGVLERAGVYVAASPRVADRAVAVNLLDETESAIASVKALAIPGAGAVVARGPAQRELWPWFVLAAAALLFVEWFVYAARMRV